MTQVPDAIGRILQPREQLIWFGKPRAVRVLLYLSPLIVAALAWFVFCFFIAIGPTFSLAFLSLTVPVFVAYAMLFQLGAYYVLTDSRVITISRTLPPLIIYTNLINKIGEPVGIKLGWIDGIHFGPWVPRQKDQLTRLVGGGIASLSFMALEDHKTVYDLALSAQRAAGQLWFARR
jgi:hypothetical protein